MENTAVMLVFWRWPNLQGIEFLKIATCGSDFLMADAVMAVTDADKLENNTEMLPEVNSVVENLSGNNSGQHDSYLLQKK